MAQKYEFLFILPDGPNGLKNRDTCTDPHERFVEQTSEYWLAGGSGACPLEKMIADARVTSKGPMYDDHHEGVERGSWVLLQASDKKEALHLLQGDPFTVGRVWDWEKAQVLSIKSGLRVPFVKSSIDFPAAKMNGR